MTRPDIIRTAKAIAAQHAAPGADLDLAHAIALAMLRVREMADFPLTRREVEETT